METMKNEVPRIFRENTLFTGCCNSQIIVENSPLDGKPPENDQGGTTVEFSMTPSL